MSEDLEARARRLLAEVDGLSEPRLRHIAGVAQRAASVGAALLADDEARVVVAAAWLHDIGYTPALAETGCHAIDGAQHLRQLGAPDDLLGLVAYHSGAEYEASERRLHKELSTFLRPSEELLDVLTFADMTIGPDGAEVDVRQRVEEILLRHPPADPVHRAVCQSRAQLVAAVRRVGSRLAVDRLRHRSRQELQH